MNVVIFLLIAITLLAIYLSKKVVKGMGDNARIHAAYKDRLRIRDSELDDLRVIIHKLETRDVIRQEFQGEFNDLQQYKALATVTPKVFQLHQDSMQAYVELERYKVQIDAYEKENAALRAQIERDRITFHAQQGQLAEVMEQRYTYQTQAVQLRKILDELGIKDAMKRIKAAKEERERGEEVAKGWREGSVQVIRGGENRGEKVAKIGANGTDAAFSGDIPPKFAPIRKNVKELDFPEGANYEFRNIGEGEEEVFLGDVEIFSARENKVVFQFHQNSLIPGQRYLVSKRLGYLLLCGMHKHGECNKVVFSKQPSQKCCCKTHKDRYRILEQRSKKLINEIA